jgi:hypothetical protein
MKKILLMFLGFALFVASSTAQTSLLDLQKQAKAGANGTVLYSNGTSKPVWTALSSLALTSGATAGGDLTGTFPNPTLAVSGATAGTYGSATFIPILTIDAKGRVTVASTIAAPKVFQKSQDAIAYTGATLTTTATAPASLDDTQVYRNGQLLIQAEDYTWTGTTLTPVGASFTAENLRIYIRQ